MRPIQVLLTVAAAASFPAAALAADLSVPRTYATIGDALAASQPGDRVIVRGGNYADVVVATDGVTLEARGGATLTGETHVDGARVTLRGFRVARGGHVVVTGDDATLAGNVLQPDPMGYSTVRVEGGARARIERNRFRRGGVEVNAGKGAVLRANRFRQSWAYVRDDDAVAESNSGRWFDLHLSGHGHAVRRNRARVLFVGDDVNGGDSTIEGNTVWRFEAFGDRNVVSRNVITESIFVGGDDVTVKSNTVLRSAMGILVRGSRAKVAGNVVEVSTVYNSTPDCPNMAMKPSDLYGIRVVAPEPGGVIEDNHVTHDRGLGLVIEASGATVSDNAVTGTSSLTSISVVGSGNTVSGNDVAQSGRETDGGNGIDVTGDANAIADNHVAGTSSDAIAVQTGTDNTVTGNVVEASRGCGIFVGDGASGTSVSGCTVTGGPLGLVNLGTGTSLGDSTLVGNVRADVLDPASGIRLLGGNTLGKVSHDAGLAPKR